MLSPQVIGEVIGNSANGDVLVADKHQVLQLQVVGAEVLLRDGPKQSFQFIALKHLQQDSAVVVSDC